MSVYVPHWQAIEAAREAGAIVADPIFYDDGERITVTWPTGRGACVASPEVVEGWVETVNTLRRELAEARADP